MGHASAIKSELLIYSVAWMALKAITGNDKSQAQKGYCYRLNVYFLQNSYVERLTLKTMVLGDGAYRGGDWVTETEL